MLTRHSLPSRIILALMVAMLLAAPASAGPLSPADLVRLQSKPWLRATTRLTREEKGQLGEENIEYALKVFGKSSYRAESAYATHQVLDHGIDAIYRQAKSRSFNLIESKATTDTGKLYRGILGAPRVGGETQMDDAWIARKLAEMFDSADRVLKDDAADLAAKARANRAKNLVKEIRSFRPRQREKTLVVTRLRPVDPGLMDDTIHPGLLAEFDHVIEMGVNHRVIRVHK